MSPTVSPALKSAVDSLVRQPGPSMLDLSPFYGSRMESVLPDVIHFRYQAKELKRRSVSQHAAVFHDGPNREEFPILVKVPDLDNVETSYFSLVKTLKESNLRVDAVEPDKAEEIFVNRLTEFMSVESWGAAPLMPTTVNSNRKGDTVIYAKGYFASTGTAFGVSTPASGSLVAGRYLFGIVDSGRQRWEDILWTCPTVVQLNLP